MIQIGTICISGTYIPSEYELSRHSLYVMECNVRRMKYMMEFGILGILGISLFVGLIL